MIFKILLFISLSIPFVVNFILWPSKKNIVFIQSIPFFILAYVGGIFFLFDEAINKHNISESNIFSLCFVMLMGSFFYSFFFFIGFKGKISFKSFLKHKINRFIFSFDLCYRRYLSKIKMAMFFLSLIVVIFYVYSYKKMGFVPMFADNPFAAKYFAGEYQERYKSIAPFFRLALNLSTIVTPFLLIFIFSSKRLFTRSIYLFLFLVIFILTLFSLRRGIVAFPIIYILLVFFIYYKRGKYAIFFVLIYILIFTFGSSFNAVFLFFIGLKDSIDIISIVKGVPDVADLLWFWDSFIKTNYEFSLGRTIYGGLIPYHYSWNPSVVTKLVIGAGKNVPTGGFRLPFQVEGYIAFGLIGTIIWSIYYGFINGLYLKLIKHIVLNIRDSFFKFYLSIFIANLILSILIFFIKMNIDKFAIIVVSLFILFFIKRVKFKKIKFTYRIT